jgi:hypothetical protein
MPARRLHTSSWSCGQALPAARAAISASSSVEALGGRLEVIAEFDSGKITLR